MAATIKSVAEYAGVSFKTVSRVINNEGRVHPDTAQKVRLAIEALNYQPNKAARNLAGRNNFVLGYVYDNPNAYYIVDMQQGVLDTCRQQGYELLIHPCKATDDDVVEQIEQMLSRSRPAGLILSPPLSEMPQVLAALEHKQVPFVRVISGRVAPQSGTSPCVLVNDYQAASDITTHLLSQGHRRIAFVGGDSHHRSTTERLNGYLDALQEAGITAEDSLQIQGQYSFKSGVESIKTLLQSQARATAVFACNDEIAAGVLFGARAAQIEVPAQLAIAGFEDSPFSTQTLPPLTTAAQPTRQIAEQATNILVQYLAALKRPEVARPPRVTAFTPQLVIRQSTLRL